MLVRMIETKRGSPDAHEVKQYMNGETYDLPDTLAIFFLKAGVAEKELTGASKLLWDALTCSPNPAKQIEALDSLVEKYLDALNKSSKGIL